MLVPVGHANYKKCSKCLMAKDAGSFYSKQPWCKSCEKDRNKSWYLANKDKRIAYCAAYVDERRSTDTEYKLRNSLRNRLNIAIKKNVKSGSSVNDLGCSISELKAYLESKFQPGMSWDNWSRDGWHIDHIIPLSSFDLSNTEELKKACHYTNLQPMWAKDNLSKSNK